ncbi:MAG TPA: VCBS domain-containing protein [Pyrinomonadaceae bacterium]|nr:VCBS domain-containing protein [Pyrinomonadaceae bacterium]
MKGRIFIVLVLVAAAWIVGRQLGIGAKGEGNYELNQSFQLAQGARVEVAGINGPVDISTTDGDTAEVHITITGRDEAAIATHRINVRQSGASLAVRGENNDSWRFWRWLYGSDRVRQSVTLKLPREVELTVRGVNGHVTVGDLAGAVHIGGINGKVEIAQATGAAEINGVNGAVGLGISHLGGDGLRVSGVNGRVELRFGEDVNADLSVRGLNGNVTNDLSNVNIRQEGHGTWNGRIGDGGTGININGVNGSVRLTRD